MSDKIRDLLQKAVEDARPKPSEKPERSPRNGKGGIVSPQDERGTKYPGDIPNPLDGTYKGCF
jgi:hypothetical protein